MYKKQHVPLPVDQVDVCRVGVVMSEGALRIIDSGQDGMQQIRLHVISPAKDPACELIVRRFEVMIHSWADFFFLHQWLSSLFTFLVGRDMTLRSRQNYSVGRRYVPIPVLQGPIAALPLRRATCFALGGKDNGRALTFPTNTVDRQALRFRHFKA